MITILLFLAAATVASATVSPSGGVTDHPWVIGQPATVEWDPSQFTDQVSIDLWDASQRRYHSLAQRVPGSTGRVSITLPTDLLPGSLYRIRVTDASAPHRYDMSTGFLTIRAPFQELAPTGVADSDVPSVLVSVTPNPASETMTVRWNMPGIVGVRLHTVNGTCALSHAVAPEMREITLPRSSLASGLYVLEVHGPNGAARSTVVLE